MHVALPGHSLRQMNRLPACGGCPTVQRCEIGSVYPAHHTAPCVRIDGFVEMQACDGRRDEADWRHAGCPAVRLRGKTGRTAGCTTTRTVRSPSIRRLSASRKADRRCRCRCRPIGGSIVCRRTGSGCGRCKSCASG